LQSFPFLMCFCGLSLHSELRKDNGNYHMVRHNERRNRRIKLLQRKRKVSFNGAPANLDSQMQVGISVSSLLRLFELVLASL